ncbi:flagellar hook-length control protein FliK [Shewanella algae]|uniref:flagellar hook-length control protein FliK n=1 Tax=Shewanella algae TaxID=38313 RepID=UPI001F1FA9F6|nr:flagellar hook-length control protein FliK [Shewanella algae]MCE9784033.1 flagellar hook-length control protein FliK [Shewanella algae]
MSIALIPALAETPAKKVPLSAHPDSSGRKDSYRQEEQSLSQAATQSANSTASGMNAKAQGAQEKGSQVKTTQGQSSTVEDRESGIESAGEMQANTVVAQELLPPLMQPTAIQVTTPPGAPLAQLQGQGHDENTVPPLAGITAQGIVGTQQTNLSLAGISQPVAANPFNGEGRGAGDMQGQSLQLAAALPQAASQVSSAIAEAKGTPFLPVGTMAQTAMPSQQLTVNAAAQLAAWHADPSSKPVAELGLQPEVAALTSERPGVSQWGPLPLSAQGTQVQHARELLLPLRDQLRFQIDQRIQTAELQLTPPELGRIELNIRLDGDRLHIQMHAANNHVRDALLSGLERLRSELAMEHKGNISLDVATDSERHQPEQDAREGYAGAIASSRVDETKGDTEAERRRDRQLNLLA